MIAAVWYGYGWYNFLPSIICLLGNDEPYLQALV